MTQIRNVGRGVWVQPWSTEIQQQSDLEPRGFQVVDDLSFLDARQTPLRLELDHYGIEAHEIGAIGGGQLLLLVPDGQFDLRSVGDTSTVELDGKRLLVDPSKKPGANC